MNNSLFSFVQLSSSAEPKGSSRSNSLAFDVGDESGDSADGQESSGEEEDRSKQVKSPSSPQHQNRHFVEMMTRSKSREKQKAVASPGQQPDENSACLSHSYLSQNRSKET